LLRSLGRLDVALVMIEVLGRQRWLGRCLGRLVLRWLLELGCHLLRLLYLRAHRRLIGLLCGADPVRARRMHARLRWSLLLRFLLFGIVCNGGKDLVINEVLTFEKCLQLSLQELPFLEELPDTLGGRLPTLKDARVLVSQVSVSLLQLVVFHGHVVTRLVL